MITIPLLVSIPIALSIVCFGAMVIVVISVMIPFMAPARSPYDTEHYGSVHDSCEFSHPTLLRKLAFRHFKVPGLNLNLDQTRVGAAAALTIGAKARIKPDGNTTDIIPEVKLYAENAVTIRRVGKDCCLVLDSFKRNIVTPAFCAVRAPAGSILHLPCVSFLWTASNFFFTAAFLVSPEHSKVNSLALIN
jgi:hypothetical protein